MPSGAWVRDYAHVYELFFGVTKNVELDVVHVVPEDLPDLTELNIYWNLWREKGWRPAVTVGATKIYSARWLPSSERTGPRGDDRISPFVVAAKTLRAPDGAPSWLDRAIKLQVGYGWNYHEDKAFGILQFAFTPTLRAAAQYYRDDWGGLIGWESPRGWAIYAGALGGDPWVTVRLNVDLSGVFGK